MYDERLLCSILREWIKTQCRYPVTPDDGDIDELFGEMLESDNISFIWGADLGFNMKKHYFGVVVVSPDRSDGMLFQTYYANGKPNVYFIDKEEKARNPDYAGPVLLRDETSYMFYSDRMLDSVDVFERRPYNSYQEFKQEFQDKLALYLPDNFDWDAHIGTFSYACYA